ncbi:DUF1987 domain-containing protein [Bacteroidales bacterium]|nr:DUF1987 domain-containing protein [Bacteroidales bacterium]
MENLHIEPSQTLPEIKLSNGHASFEGNIIPEDARKFFAPILEWFNTYDSNTIKLECTLFYINTSSTACLYDIFKSLNNKNIKTNLKWCYEEDDLDMKEMGEMMNDRFPCIDIEFIEIQPL